MTSTRTRSGLGALALLGACLALSGAQDEPAPPATRWWKGNTHAHTLWSDGDGAPELVCDWYRSHGYDFLVLSDHNVLSRGERWFPIAPDEASEGEEGTANPRLTRARVDALIERFGADAVELRDDPAPAMRLRTLEECRARFEEPGGFLLIEGEEITGRVHVNGINLSAPISAEFDGPVAATITAYLDRVRADGAASGRPTAAHLNHPNFGWAVKPADVLQIEGAFAFEVYNGHPAVHNAGGDGHASTEELWDMALTLRLGGLGRELVYAVATDDTHNVHATGPALANAGRGWIMVRAPELSADAITAAIAAGDLYATTGVLLDEIAFDDGVLEVAIQAEEDVAYTTEFVGTRNADGGVGQVGEVLFTTRANPARYTLRGDELYVRARVQTDRALVVPDADGATQSAWTQPVVP
jgi:hypothetical protein